MIIGIIYTNKKGQRVKDIAFTREELLKRIATANKYDYKIEYQYFNDYDYDRAERFLTTKDGQFTK